MGVPRVSQNQRALNGAKHVALLSSAVGGERGPRAEGGDGIGPQSRPKPPGSASAGRVGCAPLSVAKYVDEVQVSRHQRFQRANTGSMVPRQRHRASQAPGWLMLHCCVCKASERRTTWCWFTRSLPGGNRWQPQLSVEHGGSGWRRRPGCRAACSCLVCG